MVIKEEILEKGLKKFRIIVEFDGENYVASGYLDGNLINKTSQPIAENQSKTEYDGSVVDNLLFLIKDDILNHNY
ncbi:MAG: hypothetical protein WC139_11210 [Candidatus Kapaibacterium sp.]